MLKLIKAFLEIFLSPTKDISGWFNERYGSGEIVNVYLPLLEEKEN